jgi:hypothetical protein
MMKPLKMDLTEGSETSANINQTPWNNPYVDVLKTEHGESLKSRINCLVLLHAANLRRGRDGITSPPKEGMLKILSP